MWKEVDDARVYGDLDLQDFEQTFSAYQSKETDDILNKSVSKAAKGEGHDLALHSRGIVYCHDWLYNIHTIFYYFPYTLV